MRLLLQKTQRASRISDLSWKYGYISSNIQEMKTRKKTCFGCKEQKDVLYRCKYQEMVWSFLCEDCLVDVKAQNPDTYQYGGTWKAVKKS